jgi:hypothetical protein
MIRGYRAADPSELGPVKLGFRPADNLVEIKRRKNSANSEPVQIGGIIDMIGGAPKGTCLASI